jgi:hypothetical protein
VLDDKDKIIEELKGKIVEMEKQAKDQQMEMDFVKRENETLRDVVEVIKKKA